MGYLAWEIVIDYLYLGTIGCAGRNINDYISLNTGAIIKRPINHISPCGIKNYPELFVARYRSTC